MRMFNSVYQFTSPILIAMVAVLLTGCGERFGDYLVRMSPEFDSMRAKLKEVAALIPEDVSGNSSGDVKVDPPMHYEEAKPLPTNTEFMMFKNLTDPYYDYSDGGEIDLYLTKHLKRQLEWTGDKNPLAEAGKKRRVSENDLAEFEGALATRYLAVARLENFEPVVATGDNTFTGGSVLMSGHLVDLQEMKLLGSFLIEAIPAQEVSFSFKQGFDDPKDRMVAFARSTVYTSLRKQFAEKMQETFGGMFALR